ncbi:hypothetical protein SDC9_176170 [bioreactor metagenome]|uniref:Uncharacterized protein n=1 Tax=bioreactor metagenome TaxID=1076179 RepID=A0A645GPX7_9ZZZZ
MVFQCPDGVRGRLLRRIKKSQVADQHHVALIFYSKGACQRRIALLGQGDDAQPLLVQVVHCFQDIAAQLVRQRLRCAPYFRVGADGEHFFHSTLGNDLSFTRFILYHRRQAATGKIKGDLIHLDIIFGKVEELRVF